MSTEQLIQEGIQDLIQAMAVFANADVVINEWGILDQSTASAPYVIIGNSHDFSSRRDITTANTKWQIQLMLVEAFSDWPETYNNFRNRRQALIDEFNTTDNRSANGIESVTIDEIRPDGPIEGWFPPYLSTEELAQAVPTYIFQRMIVDTEDFGAS